MSGTSTGGHDRGGPVLVVDDDEASRTTVSAILEQAGFSVVEATNGREALDHLAAGLSPRAILLDLFMPVLDGWTVLRCLRQDVALAAIPVVVLTAASTDSMHAAAGATSYLRKPLDPQALLDRLATLRPAAGV